MIPCVFDTSGNHKGLVTHSFNGQAERFLDLFDIRASHVAQFDPLQVVPDALVRVQVRRISRQSLKPEALGPAIGQELLDHVPTMDRRAIPDYQRLPGDLLQQMIQKVHDIRAAIGMLLGHQQKRAIHRDAADRRYVIPRQGHAQDGRLPQGCIGTYDTGQEIEARLIYPDDRPPFFCRPLFSAGQRSLYQVSIAASSRWLARRIGFCTLQPMDFRSRQT